MSFKQCSGALTLGVGDPVQVSYHCTLRAGHDGECEVQVPMRMVQSQSKRRARYLVTPFITNQPGPLCHPDAVLQYYVRDTGILSSIVIVSSLCLACATKVADVLNEAR